MLDYVHARGIIHGDLKPENIFVLAGPRPVLVDFGVSHWFAPTREFLNLVPRGVGSAAYMAPEQIRGELTDARADLYAMGCLLYECLTGSNPFQRDSAELTLLAHLNHNVDAPSSHVAEIPRALDSLVLRLLSKCPSDRPRYVSEVLASLESRGITSGASHLQLRAIPGPLYRPALLGRERPLARLREGLARAAVGGGAQILVRGEPGIGKTRLMLEALDLGFRSGMRVVCVRCDDTEAQVGHDPLAPLRPVFALLGDLVPLLPSKERESRETRAARIADALLTACRNRGLLLAADDVDRADELTQAVLQRLALASAAAAAPLMLLYTESLGRSTNWQGFHTLVLSRLTREEVELAICSMLAAEYASPRLVDVVNEHCEGNPLLLRQLLHVLLEGGFLLHSQHSGWHLAPTFHPEVLVTRPSTGDREFWRLRLRSLSAGEHALAQTASVLGRTFDLSVLSAVAQRDDCSVRDTLVRLLSCDIVQETGSTGWYRFAHSALRDLLYESVPQETSRKLHRRAADALAHVADDQSAASMTTIAWHSKQCGRHEAAAHYYEAAGRIYIRTQRFQKGFETLTAAKEELACCTPGALQRVALLEALGDAALLIRQLDAAEAAFREALQFTCDDVAVTRLHRKLAASSQHDHAKAETLLMHTISSLDNSPQLEGPLLFEWLQSHLDLMFVYYWKRDPARVLEIGQTIKERIELAGTDEQRANYCFNVAAGLMASHRYVTGPEELELVERAYGFYSLSNDLPKISMTAFLRAMILLFSGDLENAAANLESLLAIGKKTSSLTIQVRALAYFCLVHRKRRDHKRLRRVAGATLGLAQEHDMPEYQGFALGNLAWLAYVEGNLDECEHLARSAMKCWSRSATKTAFRWQAALPLASALARRQDEHHAREAIAIVETLLHDSQQQLPARLTTALREVACADWREFPRLMQVAKKPRSSPGSCSRSRHPSAVRAHGLTF